jgi:hypothetical protein
MSLSSNAIDLKQLARLVVDVSVTWMHRERGDRGMAHANETGMYDDYTVFGEARTVMSDTNAEEDVPTVSNGGSMVSMEVIDMFSPSSSAKKYKIFGRYCFQAIGQGASFCITHNCITSHHHMVVKMVKPGKIYPCHRMYHLSFCLTFALQLSY